MRDGHTPLAVDCRDLRKTYGAGARAVPALRGIDLEVPVGSVFFLVGPSGSGKSTLISVLTGLLDGDGGSCRVLGRALDELPAGSRARFRRREIGFVFQAFNLLPGLTATENVAVPLLIQGRTRRAATARAEHVLEAVGLAGRGGDLPRHLSSGQQQRVAIARALAHRPRLIVCDEPTSALDHATGVRVMELMREMTVQGEATLIVVTHDDRILPYADYVARLDDGRVVGVEGAGAGR